MIEGFGRRISVFRGRKRVCYQKWMWQGLDASEDVIGIGRVGESQMLRLLLCHGFELCQFRLNVESKRWPSWDWWPRILDVELNQSIKVTGMEYE